MILYGPASQDDPESAAPVVAGMLAHVDQAVARA